MIWEPYNNVYNVGCACADGFPVVVAIGTDDADTGAGLQQGKAVHEPRDVEVALKRRYIFSRLRGVSSRKTVIVVDTGVSGEGTKNAARILSASRP
jgi:hypothetical protein